MSLWSADNVLWGLLYSLVGVRALHVVIETRSFLIVPLALGTVLLLVQRRRASAVSLSVLALPVLLISLYALTPARRRVELAACGVGSLAALALDSDDDDGVDHDRGSRRLRNVLTCAAVLACGAAFFVTFGRDFRASTALLQSCVVVLAQLFTSRLLRSFSDSFSRAELVCLSQMLSIVLVRAAYFSMRAAAELDDASRDAYWSSASVRVESLLYAVAVGMFLIVIGCVPLLSYVERLRQQRLRLRRRRAHRRWLETALLALAAVYVAFVLLGVITPPTSRVMRVNCWLWTLENVLAERHRLLLFTWVVLVLLAMAAPREASWVPLTVRRKYFHIIALVALVPPALLRSGPEATAGLLTSASSSALGRLASGVALAALCALELARFGKVAPAVESFMRSFTDERDGGQLIITHIYLLIGCAAPLWIDNRFDLHPMAAFTGLLIVGIGDAAASAVGSYAGRTKWPGAAPKSIEGTLGCFVATMLSALVLHTVQVHRGLPHIDGAEQWLRFAAATATVCTMEAFMRDVDNLMLPIAYLLALFAFGCI
jgi:dolichol kinase